MNRRLSFIIFVVDVVLMLIFIISRWSVRIELNGGEEVTVPFGHEYVDPGAAAQVIGKDVGIFDREIKVKTSGKVDTDSLGTYTVTYRAGTLFHHAKATRQITVVDDNAPVIVLNDVDTEIDAEEGWTDSYEAYDDRDGDLTSQVQVSGDTDFSIGGLHTLVYSVTDSAGNTATVERTVRVMSVSEPVTGPKIVFLTFDDGPWDDTDRLLDILAAHNVKATFFVTAMHEEYLDCINREAAEGHTVAVHTYSHVFDQVYSSSEAYWADFERMNDIVEERTGYRANIFRFPGGVSNTISSFNPGIMSRLAEEAHERGLEYFDWNVDCGDGGGLDDPDGVYNNIIEGIQSLDVAVVLCHDTHGTTVDAIDRVLTWGEENGYTFLPLAKGMTVCHHSIAN